MASSQGHTESSHKSGDSSRSDSRYTQSPYNEMIIRMWENTITRRTVARESFLQIQMRVPLWLLACELCHWCAWEDYPEVTAPRKKTNPWKHRERTVNIRGHCTELKASTTTQAPSQPLIPAKLREQNITERCRSRTLPVINGSLIVNSVSLCWNMYISYISPLNDSICPHCSTLRHHIWINTGSSEMTTHSNY